MDDAVVLGRNRRRSRHDSAVVAAGESPVASAPARLSSDEFAAIYRAWVGPIYRFCRLRLGDREEAEDATSSVFVRALRGLDGYRGGSIPAWLFAIARRVVADASRRRIDERIEEALDRADTAPGPEEEALGLVAAATLLRSLEAMTDDQRAVVELRVAGLTGAEIAEVLGRSEAAVKMLQLRAVQRLRALRERDGGRSDG